MLICHTCNKEHDLELAPDTGECGFCGGMLKESGEIAPPDTNSNVHELVSGLPIFVKLYDKEDSN